MIPKSHEPFKFYTVGCGEPSAQNIKHRALHESAVSLGYRSFPHLRTKGKEDLSICYSQALDRMCDEQGRRKS